MSISQDIQKIYIAFFNRPADSEGLEYWKGRIEAGISLQAIASSFTDSPEFKTLYEGTTNAEVVTSVYRNLFGREPDADGLQFWSGVLERGQIDAGMLAYEVLVGAATKDREIITNKATAAEIFTATLPHNSGAYGGDMLGEARNWLAAIDEKPLDLGAIRVQVDKMFGGGSSGGDGTPDDVDGSGDGDTPTVDTGPKPIKYVFELGWNGVYDMHYKNHFKIEGFDARVDGIGIKARDGYSFETPDIIYFNNAGTQQSADFGIFQIRGDRGDGNPLLEGQSAVVVFTDNNDIERTLLFVDDGGPGGDNGPGTGSYNIDSDLVIDITGVVGLVTNGHIVTNLYLGD